MELLLLGLAGLGGLALLLQQKPLPSQEEAEKAFAVLDKNPDDPDANTTMGKYVSFVMGDYEKGAPFLAKSKDATLKSLGEKELDKSWLAVGSQRLQLADEWVAAAKKFPALSRIFYDRATAHYIQAWGDLNAKDKQRARLQGRKLAVSRPPGAARKGLPQGWLAELPEWTAGAKVPVWDGTVARTGSYSMKLIPSDEKAKGSFSALKSDIVIIPQGSREAELSAYLLTDETEGTLDKMSLFFLDQAGAFIGGPVSVLYDPDIPFWKRVSIKTPIPDRAARAQAAIYVVSKKGNVWVDDVSLKFDGKEALKNGSFE